MLPVLPARPRYGSEKAIKLPTHMTHELALLLGAYLSEGHTNRSNWSVVITNSVLDVLEQVRVAVEAVFGLRGKICQRQTKCSYLVVASKRLVEFMDLIQVASLPRSGPFKVPPASHAPGTGTAVTRR